jgi:phage terminase large subunit-like protein
VPFDQQKADNAEKFFPLYLRHSTGRFAGTRFNLEDWQKPIIRQIFGTVTDAGLRQYRTVFAEFPRKQGKSTIGAGIALKLTCADGEAGSQVFSAAADRQQAGIVFDEAAKMVRASPLLNARLKIVDSRRNISYAAKSSFYRVVSSDAGRQHGLNPHGVIFDEVHTQKNTNLWTAMTTGFGARLQPLILAITTAGVPDESPLWWDLHEKARQIREGVIVDPGFLGIHFGADPNDDFDDPKVWHKANPGLGSILDLESFRTDYITAKTTPRLWNDWLRYRLNVPTQQQDRWLPMEHWPLCEDKYTEADLASRKCYAGLDLSTRQDITALSLIFPWEDGSFRTLVYFWLPQDNVPDHARQWVRDGLIATTPGSTIDYEFIRAKIAELRKRFDIQALSYDSWNAQHLVNDLVGDGVNCVEVRFGIRSMSLPSKEFESAFVDHRFRHNGNPVLKWMADCVSVRQDSNGNIMPVKPERHKSTKRIDGIAAMIMAYDNIVRNPVATSVYERQGVQFV